MMILTIRTDKPEAELGILHDQTMVTSLSWQAHYELAETIHLKIQELLTAQSITLAGLQGIVVFAGPGSFTGLRIGVSVANALAKSLGIPIVGATGESWAMNGASRLGSGEDERIIIPEYGSEPHITRPKK